MFGESDSESPRVPSPWDSFITPSPSPSPAPGPALLVPSQLSTNVITAIIRSRTPSPLANELVLLPKLVPESDDGNVEYKLQLLNPTHSRFLRLVTQLKWRLLEGGGQAYYELGVADSGDLIGLPRDELEQSLDTLDMMAGEIGASVIVVKEIEIPAVLATLARRNAAAAVSSVSMSIGPEEDTSSSTQEEDDADTLGSFSGTDHEEEDEGDHDGQEHPTGDGQGCEDMSATVILERQSPDGLLFSMDHDTDSSTPIAGDRDQNLGVPSAFAPGVHINVEIASVFKPRPGKKRHNPVHYSPHLSGRKGKRAKKHKHLTALDAAAANDDQDIAVPTTNGNGHHESSHSATSGTGRAQKRRFGRDRRREEKRKALENLAAAGVGDPSLVLEVTETNAAVVVVDDGSVHANGHVTDAPTAVDALVHDLDSLHVGHVDPGTGTSTSDNVSSLDNDHGDEDDDDDVFGSPRTMTLRFPAAFPKFPDAESHLHVDPDAIKAAAATAAMASGSHAVIGEDGSAGVNGHDGDAGPETRLIVEVLVVWKMPLEDQFLDFEGWIS